MIYTAGMVYCLLVSSKESGGSMRLQLFVFFVGFCCLLLHARAEAAGLCSHNNKDFKGVIKACTEVIENKSSSPKSRKEAYFIRGNNYGSDKRHSAFDAEALSDFTNALLLDPEDPEMTIIRGTQLSKLKRFSEAVIDFDHALKMIRGSTDGEMIIKGFGYINRGFAYLCMGKFDKAIADCEQVMKGPLHGGDDMLCRGMAYEKQGKQELAKRDYEQALRLSSNSMKRKANFEADCGWH